MKIWLSPTPLLFSRQKDFSLHPYTLIPIFKRVFASRSQKNTLNLDNQANLLGSPEDFLEDIPIAGSG
ncbi:hypothetical protein DP113_06470 [Brasilonema octagenarum UFV-E1]|jgi:hypothetical protein|uniref:Uncharacterized protein n=1 Tax=Brasilonema octagenarum UFV-OR1 TaxID=417115 RepID=A0ABX1M5M0_9CYAN|nr:hypothetical protein [Brasilonema octagenarum UFV-OR1]QDL13957.1 hypothetical protein DP113_06470 [Brasilonema octagenarum UFV-E1]